MAITELLDNINCQDVLVLGTRVVFSLTARDLGVVLTRTVAGGACLICLSIRL